MSLPHTMYCLIIILVASFSTWASPPKIRVLADVAYGEHDKQTLDVYALEGAEDAPLILMVHGGAWSGGDKAYESEYKHKVKHWVSKGFVLVSTNYRILPEASPTEQAGDIEAAMAFVQSKAHEWGAAADKLILMGHSSGAHLVSLVSANFDSGQETGLTPWLATVSLDISGYDIVKKNTGDTPSEFYLEIFGSEPDYWKEASPFHVIKDRIPPFLAICSTRSKDACVQAENFLNKAKAYGTTVALLAVDMSHMDINTDLGKAPCYTAKVDAFLKKLDESVAKKITNSGAISSTCTPDEVELGAL